MLNIALFGAPGAGKGTQSQNLIKKYDLVYIATGEILRQEIVENSRLGRQAKDIIEKGGLVSDEIIVQIIEKKYGRILMQVDFSLMVFLEPLFKHIYLRVCFLKCILLLRAL